MVLDYLRGLIRICVTTGCGVLILTVFVSVLLRYVFNLGLMFAEDLARYLMVVVVFLGASLALDAEQHISIRLFVNRLSPKNQLRFRLFHQVCVFVFLVIIAIAGVGLLPNQWKTDIPTMRGVSMFWFYLSIPLGCVLMQIFLVRQFGHTWQEYRRHAMPAAERTTNSRGSLAFIILAFTALVVSVVSFYYRYDGAVYLIMASCFAFTVAIGMPVAFSLGISGVCFILISDDLPLLSLPTLMFGGISPFALMAITAFILTGLLVEKSGVVESLVDFSDSLVGHLPGGLAHTNIVASMFFAGVSGAALADTAAIGSMLIPAMKESGYDKKFSAVITAASSIVGPIIPPSVGMIIYAYAAGGSISIGGLFMCGAIPGIILGLGMMGLTHIYAIRRKYPVTETRFSIKEVLIRGKKAFWGLMIPVIILAGILTGAFTPTEAGAVAAAYALFTGLVITRKLNWKDIAGCLLETALISTVIFLMLANAKIVTYILTLYEAPERLTATLQGLTTNPYIFIVLVLATLLLIGFVLEAVATMIMLVPVFSPAAEAFGIEPHHFGLLFVMIVQLALLTPPVALGLFITCRLADTRIEDVMSDVWPFLALIYGMILIIAFFPELTLWLPKMLGYIN
ncbi:MAG: TRAP transporter large permease subunit [Desulfobacterales bacterium]|nr:MAG: TRAP transporter large permease subunit [Desulfobacterales bacterium]